MAAAAIALLVALALVNAAKGPLDDPDPTRQRIGLLTSAGASPRAPAIEDWSDGPTVVLFTGDLDPAPLRAAARRPGAGLVVGTDPAAFGLDETDGGRPPVGYAIVDSDGRIRYATLDPHVDEHAGELDTMLEGVR